MAKLKEDKVLHPYGPHTRIDNSNLTDEIAQHLLDTGKATPEDFEELPGERKAPAARNAPKTPSAPRTSKAPKAPAAPKAPKAPKTTEVPEKPTDASTENK